MLKSEVVMLKKTPLSQ